MLKKILFLILCCIMSVVAFAQRPTKVNTFHLVDAVTGMPVPYISVSILRSKLAITTEENGIFNIPGDLAAMRDTIVFYAQNYAPLKLSLNKLATMDTIRLIKAIAKKKEANLKFKGKLVLNDHVAADIGLYAGVAAEGAPFNYLQIAQRFVTNTPNSALESITIHKTTDWMLTKFRVRIYDIDPATGGPGADLCDQVIDLDNKEYVTNFLLKKSDFRTYLKSREPVVDLKNYNVIIPNRSFFIAIEWIRSFFNAVRMPVYNKTNGKTDTLQVFRPYIGISPVTGPKLNIWVMDIDRKWKTYDHFYPFGTDLAIKATVEVP